MLRAHVFVLMNSALCAVTGRRTFLVSSRFACCFGAALATALPSLAADSSWSAVPSILARIADPTFAARRFEVGRFGAVGDGKSDARPGIQASIDACHAAGGGHVIVLPGDFLVNGPLHLESGVDLHVEKGATLKFGSRASDYLPLVLVRWEGTMAYNYSPLLYARDAVDIAVTGEGTIDGNARAEFSGWLVRQTPAQERLRKMGADGVPVEQRRFGEGCFLRPGMFEPVNCKNVLIEGVTLRDSPFWVVHPIFCRNVTVRRVTVDSLALNNDGCDPDSCRDVLIEGCTFHTGDDGIAIKAGRDADAWRDGRPTEDVVIRDCRFRSRINGLCIGSEMSAGVRRVFVENCEVQSGESCIYFKANRDRGGFIEDVHVRNIKIGVSRAAVVRFETNYHSYAGGHASPVFRHFDIENVTCDEASSYFLFAFGTTDSPISDVRLHDIVVRKARQPLFLRNIDGLDLDHVSVNGDGLPEHPAMTPSTVAPLKLRY